MTELEKYGNELTIVGMVVGNGNESEIIMLPGSDDIPRPLITSFPPDPLFKDIIYQMDTLQITGYERTILRKTQRNIEQKISWKVYRRDNFTCRFCGADDLPMTVDHIVRWENLGASVAENLLCTCAKCNRTRGGTEYPEWLEAPFYKKVSANLSEEIKQSNIDAWDIAVAVPLRPRRRSR